MKHKVISLKPDTSILSVRKTIASSLTVGVSFSFIHQCIENTFNHNSIFDFNDFFSYPSLFRTSTIALFTSGAMFALMFALSIKNKLILKLLSENTKNKTLVDNEHLENLENIKHYKVLVDSSIDSIISCNSKGIIINWNPASQSMFGYTESEIIGQPLTILMPEKYRTAHIKGVKKLSKTNGDFYEGKTIELEAIHKDGTIFPIQLTLSKWQKDKVHCFTGIIKDITEHKAIELERQLHNDTLEQKVVKRTEELKIAKEIAETATQAKTNFLSTMSHEIRSPLSGLIGSITILGSRNTSNLSPQQLETIRKMTVGSKHILSIINNILDFSKIEADKMTIESIHTDINQTITEAIEIQSDQASLKNVSFNFSPIDIPPVISDPTKLRQALINLISNAIKFTNKNSTISINTKILHLNHSITIRFEVVDQGNGMSQDTIKNLFTAFIQSDASITREFGGTGLGLSITKKIVEALNGSINVTSSDKGSTFYFDIPFQKSKQLNTQIPTAHIDFKEELLKNYKGHRILIVDDEEMNRTMFQKMTQMAGLVTHIAQDGKEALSFIQHNTYNAIITDLRMGAMSGIQLTHIIRHEYALSTPIIAMTGNLDDEDACIKAGVNRFLIKPFPHQDLYKILFNVFQNKL